MYKVGDAPPQREEQGSRRGLWAVVTVLAVAAFVIAVVGSAGRSAVPTGGSASSGSMGGGMAMDGASRDRVDVVARDIDGRSLRLPGGRAGAIVVIQSGQCTPCTRSVRRLAAAARRVTGGLTLTALSAQADDDRGALRRFATSVGRPPMRYLVDDRNNMLTTMLGVSQLGSIVVYDRSGKIVATSASSVAGLSAALRRVAAR
jgi:hypothetical protein